MTWNTFFGIAATLSFFLPVATIIYYKLYQHRSLAALMISFSITGLYNLISQLTIPNFFITAFGVINNYTDVPLMLFALLFFCPSKQKQKTIHLLTAAFILYEIIIASIFGLKPRAVVYIMGPGLILVLGYSFYLFVRQIKITVEFGKNVGRTLMLASILFSYGCYSLVYYFYYIQKTPAVADAFLLYFMSSLIGTILMTVGLHLIRKRMKELQEVKNTRRELAIFFNN